MSDNKAKIIIQKLLSRADIEINGSRPWDPQIHNEALYSRVLREGSLGLGESFMDGWWDVEALDQFFYKFFVADLTKQTSLPLREKLSIAKAYLLNLQTKKDSLKVAHQHYDLSFEMYMSFLDPYNQYSCAYFKDTTDLNKAQEQKLDLICNKLQLSSKDKVLDIGCGWGGFAKYAATKYGCSVTGITISKEQAKYAIEDTKGLPVEINVQDYRDLQGRFDKIVSVGMIEHVGNKNYRNLFLKVHKLLSDSGLFLLHTIGNSDSQIGVEPWMNKYIFPNSEMPGGSQLVKAADKLFITEDWHNFGAYYDLTLMAWYKRFDKNFYKFKNDQYNERFYRMFKYYLLICAGLFRARDKQLWQIVFSKNGVPGGYQSIR